MVLPFVPVMPDDGRSATGSPCTQAATSPEHAPRVAPRRGQAARRHALAPRRIGQHRHRPGRERLLDEGRPVDVGAGQRGVEVTWLDLPRVMRAAGDHDARRARPRGQPGTAPSTSTSRRGVGWAGRSAASSRVAGTGSRLSGLLAG